MAIDFTLSPELEVLRTRVRTFVTDVIKPEEHRIEGKDAEGNRVTTYNGSDFSQIFTVLFQEH